MTTPNPNAPPSLLLQFNDIFKTEAPAIVTAIKNGVEAGDMMEVIKYAHQLGSAATRIQARGLSEHCGEIERKGRSGGGEITTSDLLKLDDLMWEATLEAGRTTLDNRVERVESSLAALEKTVALGIEDIRGALRVTFSHQETVFVEAMRRMEDIVLKLATKIDAVINSIDTSFGRMVQALIAKETPFANKMITILGASLFAVIIILGMLLTGVKKGFFPDIPLLHGIP